VNAGPAAETEDGDSEEIVGTGLDAACAPLATTNWLPVLCAESVHAGDPNGERAPVEESIEKP